MLSCHILWLLLFQSLALTVSSSDHYHIVPVNYSTDELCSKYQNGTCFTIKQLVQTDLLSAGDNLILTFLPGKHLLTGDFVIHDFSYVFITGLDTTVVSFHGNSGIKLSSLNKLHIKNISFVGINIPGAPSDLIIKTFTDIQSYDLENSKLLITDTQTAIIENTVFMNNTARALYVEAEDVHIVNSEFTANNGGAAHIMSSNAIINITTFSNNRAGGGGAMVLDSPGVIITKCNFSNNTAYGYYGNAGAIYVLNGEAYISNSTLTSNVALGTGGVIYADYSNVFISNSTMINNSADYGGAIDAFSSNVSITNSALKHNNADQYGGAIYALSPNIFIFDTILTNNTADWGGVIYAGSSNVSISNSTVTNNSAHYGGIICAGSSNVSIFNSTLTNNSAGSWGGVINADTSNVSISYSTLTNNSADSGGVIDADSSNVSISNSTLTMNRADDEGGVIYAYSSRLTLYSTKIINNTVKIDNHAIIYLQLCTTTFHGVNISENRGITYVFGGKVKFNGQTVLKKNDGLSGGGINAEQCEVYFNSTEGILITSNTATHGGGIFLRESTLFVYHKIEISHNTAKYGGGIYAYSSRVEFEGPVTPVSPFQPVLPAVITIADNTAQSGGGIYATASNIKISQFYVDIVSNTAMANGGGMYLEKNSDVSIVKRYQEKIPYIHVLLQLSNNTAQYGGGIFLGDDTEGEAACGESNETCFIQTIKLYNYPWYDDPDFFNTFMTNNTATSGGDIFGGLLDRCTASKLAEVRNLSGIDYIRKTVASSKSPLRHDLSISSKPIQVLFCNTSNIIVRKGDNFKVRVMAVDQVGNPVNATIHSSVVTKSGIGRLREGQEKQTVGVQCAEIMYNVFSQDSSARVELYAKGPCGSLGISKQTMNITFLPCTCPIGLQPTHYQSDIDCQCDCDPILRHYQISVCSQKEGTIQLENNPNIWIGVVNTTNETGYIISDCPFDYCVEKPANISLSISSEIDQQCAYNRSGVLCGECQQNFSLVFATSNCQDCSNLFLLLLIPFALAGIALVAFILLLNITIATGTIHGLIFYTNIIAANKATFVPFSNFLTVFVSWMNLDLGIETCFYNGMSSQAKVLLQLVFPAYLFLLTFVIIIVSKYSSWFSKLLSTRNPVAALATLILLSYSKLIRFIISALQYRVLDYPDGEQQIVWLYNGNVQYFAPEHIPQLVIAAIILTAGGLFTVLLFFGQWLPRCSKLKLIKWTKNTKYIAFIDAYHSPFTTKHRYWLGLLLFALITQNIISAMSLHPILIAGCLPVGIFAFKSLNNRVYKSRFNDILETLFLLNLVILTLGTLKVGILKNGSQEALANVSMSIAFVQFVVIVAYHFYKFILKKNTALQVNLPRNVIQNRIINLRRHYHQPEEVEELMGVWDYEPREIPPGEDDPDRYITPPIVTPATRPDQLREPALDILAPLTTEDYQQALPTPQDNHPQPPVTHTVIEAIHHDDSELS